MAALALTSASFAVYADSHSFEKGDRKCHGSMHQKHKNMSPEARQAKMEKRITHKVERMTKKLDLNEKQQRQLTQILEHKALKKRELYKESKQQILDILNPEQVQKMQKLKEERHSRG